MDKCFPDTLIFSMPSLLRSNRIRLSSEKVDYIALVEKTEQKRRKKWSACSLFFRYDRFQMKEIVGMFGLESKKASVCSVLRDSVCSVRNVRKFRYVRFSQIRYNRFQTKEIAGMFGLERKKASVCLVSQDSVCSVFKHKKSSDFFIGKIDISVYNVVKRYDGVLFAGISNVRLKEKFWKSVQNS